MSRRRRALDDLSADIEDHIARETADNIAKGMAPEIADRAARLRFGNTAIVREDVRRVWIAAWVDDLRQDLRSATRALLRSPSYAAAAILTLALGVGATTAVFAVADATLFKPLPYKSPEQLVLINQVLQRGTPEQRTQTGMTWDQIDRWRNTPIFEAIETFAQSRLPVTGSGGAALRYVSSISPGMITLLGSGPLVGRAFANDDATPSPAVCLLSESFWRSAYRADTSAIGQTIQIENRPYTIVGVMPATFRWGVGSGQTAVWLPLDENSQRGPNGRSFVGAIARLHPGLTIDQGKVAVARTLVETEGTGSLDRRYDAELVSLDNRELLDGTNKVPLALAALLGAVFCVLLITCANVSNLALSRILARRRELAIRGAIGATRTRLFRHVLTEGALLVACGGFVALIIAVALAQAIPTFAPSALGLFEANVPSIDSRALFCFALATAIATILACVVPACRAASSQVLRGLDDNVRIIGTPPRWHHARHALQAGQVALTLVLLAGAGLLASSFLRMVTTTAGYDVDRLVAATLSLPRDRYASPAVRDLFFETLISRIRATPGLKATYGPPPTGSFSGGFVPFGRELEPGAGGSLSIYFVSPDYLTVAGIPMKAGRVFNDSEAVTGQAVGVIDERTAARYWPGQSAIGQRFRYGPNAPWVTIVGIAGHVKTTSFTSSNPTMQTYVPAQMNTLSPLYRPLLMRTTEGTDQADARLRMILRSLDDDVQPREVLAVANMYDNVLTQPRFFAFVMTIFACVALATASVGLYGLVNYAVGQKTREIAIRVALGADVAGIRRLVLREALLPVSVGLAGGLVASIWLARYLSSLMYGMSPHDPATFAMVMLLLIAVAAIAAGIPARRATRIAPTTALGAE